MSLVVDHVTSESFSLHWSPPEGQFQNGIITGYLVNVTAIGTPEIIQVSSITNSVVMRSLRPFTTYVCIVAAETSAGIGPFSTAITVQTNESGKSLKYSFYIVISCFACTPSERHLKDTLCTTEMQRYFNQAVD